MIDRLQLQNAYCKARDQLLAARGLAGHWRGQLSSSAVSTATAVSALSVVADEITDVGLAARLRGLATAGTRWLLEQQNDDGGWGDTDRSYSNVATSLLCRAALELSGVVSHHAQCLQRANAYIDQHGSVDGVRARYGSDKTFAVPILTNAAIAGIISWDEVAPLPFEFAWLPQSWYRLARLPVVSYAIPALVAIGQAKFVQQPPRFFLLRWLRGAAVEPTLKVLERMQPTSGGYLEATPLTSFVVMSLAAVGRADHAVARRGIDFIIASAREDGSWPIDTDLATWNTTLAVNVLASGGEDIARLDCLTWLFSCQHRKRHPFTGAEPGGWGWTDLSGAVPDADDTPGALLALAAWRDAPSVRTEDAVAICRRAGEGLRWLLDLQNGDGGWPTFCRGWGRLPFDRSGSDLTAHALRALRAWQAEIERGDYAKLRVQRRRLARAVAKGFSYLKRNQQAGGYWTPLWFGNQAHPREENPVYGTAKVLMCYRDWQRGDDPSAHSACEWLAAAQDFESGGWGAADLTAKDHECSVEETALATEALLAAAEYYRAAAERGVAWLLRKLDSAEGLQPAPIGFYFAKLWYYESLYPIIFTVSALGAALHSGDSPETRNSPTGRMETGISG